MVETILYTIIAIVSLLIGYNLGKHQSPIPPEAQEKLKEIFTRSAPFTRDSGVGVVNRPTARENYLRDNPEEASTQEQATKEFDILKDLLK